MSLGGFFKKIGKGTFKGLKVVGIVGKDHLLPIGLEALPLGMGRAVNELIHRDWGKAVEDARNSDTGIVDEEKLKVLLMERVLDEIHKRQPDRKSDT